MVRLFLQTSIAALTCRQETREVRKGRSKCCDPSLCLVANLQRFGGNLTWQQPSLDTSLITHYFAPWLSYTCTMYLLKAMVFLQQVNSVESSKLEVPSMYPASCMSRAEKPCSLTAKKCCPASCPKPLQHKALIFNIHVVIPCLFT